MKFTLSLLAVTSLCLLSGRIAGAAPEPPPTMNLLATLNAGHPRLIASSTTWDNIKVRRTQDPMLDAYLKRNEVEARAILGVPPIPYKKDGKRLLHVSRVVLRRVILLSMQYHLTGDTALAKRAQQEMMNVAAFNDWNPSHFLDVAEITTALALGYDWLYDELDETARTTIATAIIEKGLKPSQTNDGWKNGESNWNSVCFCGMSLGALAVADIAPDLAEETLEKAKAFNHNGLKVYAPAGVYPEGPMYWAYGTTFEAIMLNSLQTALGTDWGLSQSPGFLQSPDALLHSVGPTGESFNYSDGVERPSMEGGNFWFARVLNRPELVRFESERLTKYSSSTKPSDPLTENDRTMPLIAIWWPNAAHPNAPEPPLDWYGAGHNPIATFRSSWSDPNAMYLALKGGQASQSHGHMDVGSFVFESDGVRWARDLGMQQYLSLESKGIDLWNSAQNAGRWSVFRLNNLSHNTLTVNGQLHRAAGIAPITHFSAGANAGATVDMTAAFAGQASRVERGFAFRPNDHTLIRDELEGLKAGDKVRWAMVTSAAIVISKDGKTATLSQNGKNLSASLDSASPAKFEVISADPPQNNYDVANPNTRILIANFTASASGHLQWSMTLRPGGAAFQTSDPWTQLPLKDWPLNTER